MISWADHTKFTFQWQTALKIIRSAWRLRYKNFAKKMSSIAFDYVLVYSVCIVQTHPDIIKLTSMSTTPPAPPGPAIWYGPRVTGVKLPIKEVN
jgi:hypothetical protein